MPSLKDELLTGITKTKQLLYPLLEKSEGLNTSAQNGNVLLKKAYDFLDHAAVEITARANDDLPPIQRRY
jgi:hypothetical protein